MAKTSAAVPGTLASLRREIAVIEDTPARFGGGADWNANPVSESGSVLKTGIAACDRELGGGVSLPALSEFHAREARDAGLASGFLTALFSLSEAPDFWRRDPVLWIGAPGAFAESGAPYGRGMAHAGFAPERLLLVEPEKLDDALWIAEEAARTGGLAATVLDMRGESRRVDLRTTQRLHRRARTSGRPVFLLRQSAGPEPTAAPLRLVLAAAPSAPAFVLEGTPHQRAVDGGIGPPGFCVTIEKNKAGPIGRSFVLHWNSHERQFHISDSSAAGAGERVRQPRTGTVGTVVDFARPAYPGPELSVPGDGPDRAGPLGQGMARRRQGTG